MCSNPVSSSSAEVVPTRKTSPWGKSSPFLTINENGEAVYKVLPLRLHPSF